MRTTTANYTTYNANLYKNPVYIVEFGAITTKYVSGTWNNIGSYTTKKYVRNIRASYGKIDVHEPDLTASTFEVDIVDKSSEFISFMNSNSLWGKAMVIKIGFQELDYTDFVTLTPSNTVIIDIRLSSDLITWTIQARDNLFGMIGTKLNDFPKSTAGANLGTLGASIGFDEVTSMQFTGNDSAFDTSFGGDVNSLDNRVFTCVRVDSEIIKYTGKSAGPPATLDTLTRGLGGTSAVGHTSGARLMPGIGFTCDPLRIMLHLLTSSVAGTNGRYDLNLSDSLSTSYNFKGMTKDGKFSYITYTDINIDNIERLGYRLFHEAEYSDEGYFFIFYDQTVDLLDTIQDKLLKPHGLYLVVNGGKIDVGHNDYVYFTENFSASDTLTDSNIKAIDGLEHAGYDQVYNSYAFNDGYDYVGGEFSEAGVATLNVIHNDTASTYYSNNKLLINHYGATTTIEPDLVKHLVRYRFGSFADISTIIRADCFHNKILLEPGDTPSVTTSYLANIDSGARGWSTVKAKLLGQELTMGLNESSIENELRVFTIPGYVDNAVSGYYAINKVVEANINDKALAVSTDLTATTEAADAYYDNSGTAYQADRIIFFIRITQPNYGAGSTCETIDLQVSWLDSGPAIQNSDRRRYIVFNPQASTAFTVAIDLYGKSATADTPNKVKVDWNATTATGSEIPTVEFIGVWFVKSNLVTG